MKTNLDEGTVNDPAPASAKRRRFQFTVRGLFFLTALVAVLCGLFLTGFWREARYVCLGMPADVYDLQCVWPTFATNPSPPREWTYLGHSQRPTTWVLFMAKGLPPVCSDSVCQQGIDQRRWYEIGRFHADTRGMAAGVKIHCVVSEKDVIFEPSGGDDDMIRFTLPPGSVTQTLTPAPWSTQRCPIGHQKIILCVCTEEMLDDCTTKENCVSFAIKVQDNGE